VNEMTVTVCIIEGSWGRLQVDTETGDVLRLSGAPKDAESEGYHDIARFDLENGSAFTIKTPAAAQTFSMLATGRKRAFMSQQQQSTATRLLAAPSLSSATIRSLSY
jgi:hypothetical protein